MAIYDRRSELVGYERNELRKPSWTLLIALATSVILYVIFTGPGPEQARQHTGELTRANSAGSNGR